MVWVGEAVVYGLIIANGLGVIGTLVWAWRRGYLHDLDGAAEMVLQCEAPESIRSARES